MYRRSLVSALLLLANGRFRGPIIARARQTGATPEAEPPVAAWVAGPRAAPPEAAETLVVVPEPGAQPAAAGPVEPPALRPVVAVVKPAKHGRTSCSEPCALQVETPP